MDFELMTWADGVPHLFYQDSISGQDIVVALEEDGAYHCYYDNDGNTVREKVDLVDFLRSFAKERGI